MFFFISKKRYMQRLREARSHGYTKGIQTGFTLGFEMGKIEKVNQLFQEGFRPRNALVNELNDILKQEGF